jgi:hypothetical protein
LLPPSLREWLPEGHLGDLHQSIAGQYGSQSAAGAVVSPNAEVRRELHQSIAGQYGLAR